jgi:DNA polymerase IV
VAKMASDADKPRGFLALTRTQASLRFGPQPCSLIPGIGPKTAERLRRLGISTIEQLASTPTEILSVEFGARQGPWLRGRSEFRDQTPVVTRREAVSESRETTFDVDVESIPELQRRLDILSGELASALRSHGHRGRTVAIKIRYSDFETHTKALTLKRPVADAEAISTVARGLLSEFGPTRPVRLIGVRVAGFETAEASSGQMALPFG